MAKMTELIVTTMATSSAAKTTKATQNTPTRTEKRKKKIKYRDKMKFINALILGLIVVVLINELEKYGGKSREQAGLSSMGVMAQTRDPRFYSRVGVNDYQWPNPGDPDYRTYTFNDRRYGHYQPNGYGANYPGRNPPGQYPQGMPNEDRFRFDPVS